jgi:proteasome-associated ATPase
VQVREQLARAERLHEECEALKKHIEGIEATSTIYAGVVEVRKDEKRVIICSGEQMGCYEYKPHMGDIEAGDLVKVSKDGCILAVEKNPPAAGKIHKVSRRLGGFLVCEDRVVVDRAQTADVGHEVLLDTSGTCVVRDLGKPPSKLAFTEKTGVSWDDIGGQEEAKRQIREAIEGPVLHADLYEEFGLAVPKGILLYGPPGCSKTMFAKAMATAVADLTGHKAAESGFIYVKGPEVINKYVGESEAGVRAIFEAARAHHQEHHYPAVICIDEADALVGARRDSNLTLEKTIVPQFLAEMDGLDQSGALVVLLTNRPDTLDPAIVRDGRIDMKIKIGRPTKDEAVEILHLALNKKLVAKRTEVDDEPAIRLGKNGTRYALAQKVADAIWEARDAVAVIHTRAPAGGILVGASSGKDRRVALPDLVSGAMLVGMVGRAARKAVRRYQDDQKAQKGITWEDLSEAIKETPSHVKGLNLSQELADVVAELGGPRMIERIEPL